MLSMKLSNCHFSKEIQYLGHISSTKGIQPLPSKTQEIKNMHPLTTPKQVHAFLVQVGYYWKFIKNFAKIAKPLTLLTLQQVKFIGHQPTMKPSCTSRNPSLQHPYYITLTLIRGIQSTQMHWMKPAECTYPRNMMVQNSQLLFFHTRFQKLKENGA